MGATSVMMKKVAYNSYSQSRVDQLSKVGKTVEFSIAWLTQCSKMSEVRSNGSNQYCCLFPIAIEFLFFIFYFVVAAHICFVAVVLWCHYGFGYRWKLDKTRWPMTVAIEWNYEHSIHTQMCFISIVLSILKSFPILYFH